MPDLLGDHRDALIARATQQAESVLSSRSINATVNRESAGAPSYPGTMDPGGFASGYDAGVTILPFMLDYSTLDGPDILT